MKKLVLVLALMLGLVGSTGIRSAEAVFVNVNWATKSIISVTNPQKYQMSVYSAGTKQGPNFPPLKGGNVVMLDITDRTMTQLDYLTEDFGGDPEGGKRYELHFNAGSDWMRVQLFKRGFITTTWARIRGSIWDNQLEKSLAGVVSRYSEPSARAIDDCYCNCDYQACVEIGSTLSIGAPSSASYCECEEYQGRIFCHKNNRFTYTDVLDH